MKQAIKEKIVKAYCLGDNSEMERKLTESGKIVKEDDHYRIFSQECNNEGERAETGDYFKVDIMDGDYYPYPNKKEFFLKYHKHINNDEYIQSSDIVNVYMYGEEANDEIKYLFDQGLVKVHEDDEENYYSAKLWGTDLTLAKDGIIVIYKTEYDGDQIKNIDFNFVAKKNFEENYKIVSR